MVEVNKDHNRKVVLDQIVSIVTEEEVGEAAVAAVAVVTEEEVGEAAAAVVTEEEAEEEGEAEVNKIQLQVS